MIASREISQTSEALQSQAFPVRKAVRLAHQIRLSENEIKNMKGLPLCLETFYYNLHAILEKHYRY
jgi:hypothetical protein